MISRIITIIYHSQSVLHSSSIINIIDESNPHQPIRIDPNWLDCVYDYY